MTQKAHFRKKYDTLLKKKLAALGARLMAQICPSSAATEARDSMFFI